MTLICFKNGSLAREKIRELYGIPDWKKFGEALKATPPGNHGGILLPWFEAEIVPRVNQPGIHRFDLDEKDAAANCRAIFEAQMMSMRLHSQWMQVAPESIFATGGASQRPRVVAGDGRCDELPRASASRSPRAPRWAPRCRPRTAGSSQAGEKPKWEKLVAGFTAPVPGSEIRPNTKAAKIYDKLMEKYAAANARR